MKIAFLNDTHCGIRNASNIFLDNAAEFYSKVFFPYCEEHNIKQIIHLGDYYDNRNSLNVKALHHNRKNFLEPMRELGMSMDIFPGNHDTYYKNTNSVNSLKEALGFFMNEIHIIQEPSVLEYGSTKFAMVPWINSENYAKTMTFIQNCRADVLCGHLDLHGFELMKGMVNTHGMDPKIFSRFELVLSGHFHTRSAADNILYLGSQMEFFWSDAHDPKYFYVIDTETRELERVQNPYTLFEKIVYNDSKYDYSKISVDHLTNKFVKIVVEEKRDTYMFDLFVDKVQKQQILELKIAETFSEFLGENVEDAEISVEDTEVLLDSYIDAVDTELDKDRIKKDMKGLMQQAQSLEIV